MAESVAVERRGFTQVITINRPEVKNALDGAAARALAAAADELDADDDLRVGVLTGAGGTFCAGMDLKAYLRGDKPNIEGRGFGGITIDPAAQAAHRRGGRLGAGRGLRADAGVRPGRGGGEQQVRRARGQARPGAGGGGALLLPRRIPFAVAMELLLTGEAITPDGRRSSGSSTGSSRTAGRWTARCGWPRRSPPTGRWPWRSPSRSPVRRPTGRSPKAGSGRRNCTSRSSIPRTPGKAPPRSQKSGRRRGVVCEQK
jgi:hypothetical protein